MKLLSWTSLVFLFFCLVGCSNTSLVYNNDKKAHHTENGFKNIHIEDPNKGFFDYLSMRFLGDEPWADHIALSNTVAFQAVDVVLITEPKVPQITWFGHSTFLIQRDGINILTDPIFSNRASPTSFAGPKRYTKHAIDYDKLPNIDWVIISHNHYDHLDVDSIEMLVKKSLIQTHPIQFVVPLGLQKILLNNDVLAANIHELDWWQSTTAKNIKVEALPSQHWSSRSLGDMRQTLWASWAITFNTQTDENTNSQYVIWFAGDTGYNKVQFREIGNYLGASDLALIPIGAYAPRWFMQPYHVNPEEAIKLHQDVNSLLSIGMHWGTFPLTAEAPMAPVEELTRQKQLMNINDAAFITMSIGQTLPL